MPLFGEIVVIKRNGSDGTHFPLTATTCLFGRKTECDIRIQLPHVSKEHCKVEVKENKEVFATNLSTVNPTQLNGKAIQQPVRLKHGDMLTIIDRSFRFEEPRSKPARRRSTGLGSETYQVSASEQSANIDETVRVETPKTSKRLRKSEGSFTKMTHDRRSLQISSSRDNKDSSPFSELYEMFKSKVESKKAKSPLKQAGRSPRNTKSESILQAVNYPQPTVTSRRSFTRSQASDAYGETPIVVGGQDKTRENKHQLIENTDAVAMDKANKDSHIGQEAPGGGETNKKLRTPEKSSSPQSLSSQTPSSNSTLIPYDEFISMLGREDESENKRSPKQSLNSEQVKSATKVFSPRNTKSGVSPRQRKMKESASVLSGKEISESTSEDSQLQHFDKSHTQGRGRGSLSGQIQKLETVNKSSPKTELIAHEDLNTSPLSRRLSRKSVRNASPKALDLTESTATKKSPRKRRSDELSLLEPPMKRKRVSFGGHLSPELFDKRLPPNSPLKRGATPARRSLSIDLPRAVIRKSFGLKHSLLQEISEQSGSSSRVASSALISGKGTPVSSPAKSTPAKRSPGKATPSKSSPARANTANVTPAKKSPLRASPAKSSLSKTTPAKRSPLRASPAKTTPAKRSPLRASPAKSTPAKRSPLRASPAKSTPAKRSPLRASPAKSTPAKRSPLRASPAKSTPAKRSPLRASPAKSTPAKRSPLRASPAKSTPAKRSPLRASHAKSTPAKRSPLRASPAKSTPAKRSPLRASPAKSTPAKRSPLRASPAKSTPAKRSPLRASPAKSTPAKRSPLRASPAKSTPAKRSPLRASPAKSTPAKRSPLRASPAKSTPAKRSPLRASPAKSTPAKRSPLRASPAKSTPAKRSPLRASPAKSTPAKRSPLRASPAKSTPAKRSPLRASPAKSTPAKRSPLRASPAKSTPAKRPPLRASPAKSAPAKRSPLRASPAKSAPAKRSPARASPAKSAPAKRSPARASPAKATPAKSSPARASPAKATPAKNSPARASPAKRSPARPSPAKATPAKRSPARPSLAMESLVVQYTKGRFSVSRINTPPQVDIVAVDAARGSFTEQTPNKSRKSLTLKKTPLRRSRKLNAIEVIRSRRRSGATEANLLLAKSWAEVVKSGVVKPQKASTKPGYKVKITRKKKPKTPTRKMERADHADSPATILIGRAHTRSVNSIGHVPKIVRNRALKIDTDQNESFTGITELFNTPVDENQRKSTRLENKTATPKSSAAEVSVMKTPEESGEMVVSPINSPITTQRKKYSREAVSRLLRSPVSPQLLIGNEQMGTTAMPVVMESAEVETENTTRAKRSNVLKDKRKTIDLTGIKRIMKTPKQKRTPVTDPVALKKLLRTPKQVESLPVIYTRRSSEFNQMVGVKRLLTTPKVRVPPVENLSGIKRIMKTPKQRSEPVEDLTGIKHIMKTPRQKGEPVEDMVGIKRIMRTPKQKGEPVEDMVGIKRIMRTPKQKGQPVDDMMGISHIMSTPPENTHPIEEIFGIKQLIKTPPKKSTRIEEVPAQENLTLTENNGPTGSLENLKSPSTTPRSGKGRLSRRLSGSLVTEEQQDTVTGELKTQPSPKSKKTPVKLSQPPADIRIKDHVNEQALPESNLQQEKSDDKQTPRRSRSSRSTAFDLSTSELIGLENSETRISEDSPQNTGLSYLGAPQASEPASSGLITSPKRKGRFSRGQTTALAPVGDDSTSSPPKQKDAPSNSLQKEVSLSVGSKELPIEKQPPCDALSDSEADKLGLSPRRGRLPKSSTKAPKESLSEPSKESLQDKSEVLDASLSTRSRGRKAGQRKKIIQDPKLANESDSKGKPVSKSELKKSKTSENAETPVPPELLQIEDLDAEAGAKKSTVAQRRMKRNTPLTPALNPEEVSERTEDSTDKNSPAGNTGSRRTGRNKKNDLAENKQSSGPEESHLQTRRRVLSKSKASQSPEPKSVTRSSRHQKEAVPDTNTELQSKTSRGRQTKNTRKDESPPEKPDEESTATENRSQLVRRGRFARVNKTVPNSEAISKEEITQNEVQQPSPTVSKNIRGRKKNLIFKEHTNVALTEDKDNETEALKETTTKKSTRGKKIIPQELPKELASEAVQNAAQLEEDGKRVQKERSSKAKSVQWHPLVVTQETSENEDAAQSTENETSTRGRSKGKNRREIEPTVSAKRSRRGKVEENSSLGGLVYPETNSSPEVKKSPATTRSGKKGINKPTQVKNVQEVSSEDSSIVPEILVQPVGLEVADEKEKSKKGKRGAKSSQQNLPSVSHSEANADSVTNKRGGRRVASSKGLESDNKVDENAVSNKRGRRAANPSPPKVELKRSLVKKQEVAEDSISKSRRGVKRKINPEPVNESLNSVHTNDDLQSNKTNMDSVLSGRAKKARNSSMQNEVADSPAKKKKTEAATATQKKEKSRSASKTEKEKAAKIPTRASTRSRK